MIKILKFGAQWCSPCKSLNPIFHDIEKLNLDKNVQFESIDIDQQDEDTVKYSVRSIPTIVYLKDDVEIYRSVGFVQKQDILNKISELSK